MIGNGNFLLCYGLNSSVYEKALPWLNANPKRRLVFVEEDREKSLLSEDRRVKLFYIDSPLQMELIAREIAWQAVFLEPAIIDAIGSEMFQPFKKCFEECHRAANLLLSDGAEWGVPLARNARKNLKKPFKRALDLHFEKIPAVIVGAGPSLEKNRHFLEAISKRALILAGGNALRHLPVEPHFAGAIDGQARLQNRFRRSPLCFQARMHAENLKGFEGERLLAPDSHFAFLNWIAKVEEPFDGGWTVGNFLTRLAFEWGCDPIVFVGMDGCSPRKMEGMIQVSDGVWSRPDWIQAKRWTEALARQHPERKWINATEGGMGFQGIEEKKLKDLIGEDREDLKNEVKNKVAELPLLSGGRWEEWKENLRAGSDVVTEKLLEPLWQLWKPVFERELEFDSYEGKMEINQKLFFEQVIEEHLR